MKKHIFKLGIERPGRNLPLVAIFIPYLKVGVHTLKLCSRSIKTFAGVVLLPQFGLQDT